MCLAIYKPSKVLPDWEALEEGFRSNSHGAGFAVIENGRAEIHKGYFKFADFEKAFRKHADKQALIHFRLATHGTRDAAMCHPFTVTEETVMIHNGVLPIDTSEDKQKSDTWHYVEYVLKPLAERDRDFYSDGSIKFLGEAAISGSKFVFLRSDGDWCIWNDSDGHWNGDTWYSNRSYENRLVFARWPKKELPPIEPYVDAGESRYYEQLSKSDQWNYEDCLEAGFDAAELDEYIANEGPGILHALAKDSTYEEENV